MSIFEILMLLCFAAGWPFSIYKSYTSRVNSGKSLGFLVIVVIGYISGIIHKLLYSYDGVIYLYAFNGIMVAIDIAIYWRNSQLAKKASGQARDGIPAIFEHGAKSADAANRI